MYKLTVIYGQLSSREEFDYDYYVTKHIPLAVEKLKARRAEVDRFVSNPQGGEPAFHVIAHLYFDSQEELMTGMTSPDAAPVMADIPNYYKGKSIRMAVTECREYTP